MRERSRRSSRPLKSLSGSKACPQDVPPPDKIDPADAWAPWRPSAADPWSRKWAAHLYRRAAFGATRQELIERPRSGPDGTLDLLLQGEPDAAEILPTLLDVGRTAATRDDGTGTEIRGWWLYCMLQGGHPLREKLTLFWHNHFATSIAKVRDANLMFRQNCLLREHALGKFGPFLQAISRDAAMLVWLDSNSNVKGKPNENYARELMELFSLGVGNYTEKDIREAARAFTGWHTDGKRVPLQRRGQHDDGRRRSSGKTGNWDGGDVVRIVLEQPAAARFLVRKLYAFFVSEIAPPDALLEPLCESFRKSDYDIAALVRTMLSSRLFFSEHAFRKRIKSPVEYVLGAVRAVYRATTKPIRTIARSTHRALVRPADRNGPGTVRAAERQGLAGRPRVAEHLDRAGARQLRRGAGLGPLVVGRADAVRRRPTSLPPPTALDPARFVEETPDRTPETPWHAC